MKNGKDGLAKKSGEAAALEIKSGEGGHRKVHRPPTPTFSPWNSPNWYTRRNHTRIGR